MRNQDFVTVETKKEKLRRLLELKGLNKNEIDIVLEVINPQLQYNIVESESFIENEIMNKLKVVEPIEGVKIIESLFFEEKTIRYIVMNKIKR